MKREKKLGIRRKIKSNICEFRMEIESGIRGVNSLLIDFQPNYY